MNKFLLIKIKKVVIYNASKRIEVLKMLCLDFGVHFY